MRKVILGVIVVISFSFSIKSQIIENIVKLGSLSLIQHSPSESIGNVSGFVRRGKEFAIVSVTDGGIAIVDVSNPKLPKEASFVPIPNGADRLYYTEYYSKGYIYATMRPGPLQIINVKDPYNAFEVKQYNTNFTEAYRPWVDELRERLYLVDLEGNPNNYNLLVLDISDPENPVELGGYSRTYHHIYVRNDTCYGFGFGADVDILNVSDPLNIILIKHISTGLPKTHSGWLHDNGKYLTVDHEYAPGEGPDSLGGHLQIFNIENLPNDPNLLSEYYTPTNHIGEASLHHSYWYYNLIYMSYWTEGLRIVDATNPNNPILVGTYDWDPDNINGIYRNAWGVYPYLPSRNILVSKRKEGLYVFDFTDDGPGIYYDNPDTVYMTSNDFQGEFVWSNGDSIVAKKSFVFWRSSSNLNWNKSQVYYKSDSTYYFRIQLNSDISYIEYYIEVEDINGKKTRAPGKAPFLDWYEVYLSRDNSLPVSLLSFSGKYKNKTIHLSWTTGSEYNILGYDIWRKTQSDFVKIASYQKFPELQSEGNSNTTKTYHFIDKLEGYIKTSNVFYLLYSVDYSGKTQKLSEINVPIINQEYKIEAKFFPNPFNNRMNIKLQFPPNSPNSIANIAIYDINGKKIKYFKKLFSPNSTVYIQWDGTNQNGCQVPSGIYFITISIGSQIFTQKIFLIR